jgi:hypothetical protein
VAVEVLQRQRHLRYDQPHLPRRRGA